MARVTFKHCTASDAYNKDEKNRERYSGVELTTVLLPDRDRLFKTAAAKPMRLGI
jgi:hypothetical protein